MLTRNHEDRFFSILNKIKDARLDKYKRVIFDKDKYIQLGDHLDIIGMFMPDDTNKLFCCVWLRGVASDVSLLEIAVDRLSTEVQLLLIMRLDTYYNNKMQK